MLRAMREVDNGVPVSVVCRKVGMVEKTFYRYREKYQGMEPTEARRLRELEEGGHVLSFVTPERVCTRQVARWHIVREQTLRLMRLVPGARSCSHCSRRFRFCFASSIRPGSDAGAVLTGFLRSR